MGTNRPRTNSPAFFLLPVALWACGGSSTSPGADAEEDGTAPRGQAEGAADSAAEAGASTLDDGLASCGSVSQACPDGGPASSACISSWGAALQPVNWCNAYPGFAVIIGNECAGYDFVRIPRTDSSSTYYYDPGTGALVGVAFEGNSGTTCFGVNPEVSESACADGGWQTFSCTVDGGVGD